MTTTPSANRRRSLVETIVRMWGSNLSAKTQQTLSIHDIDALEVLVFAAIEVILARRGSIPGLTQDVAEEFASMRQDLDGLVLDGLRDLEMRVPPDPDDPLVAVGHEQVDPSVVAGLLYRASDLIEEQRVRLADKEKP